jgi:hypothetical protein
MGFAAILVCNQPILEEILPRPVLTFAEPESGTVPNIYLLCHAKRPRPKAGSFKQAFFPLRPTTQPPNTPSQHSTADCHETGEDSIESSLMPERTEPQWIISRQGMSRLTSASIDSEQAGST